MKLPYSGKEYTLRDPKGKDLRAIGKTTKDMGELDMVFQLVTLLAEPPITPEELDDMDAEDVTALMSAIKSKRVFGNKGSGGK